MLSWLTQKAYPSHPVLYDTHCKEQYFQLYSKFRKKKKPAFENMHLRNAFDLNLIRRALKDECTLCVLIVASLSDMTVVCLWNQDIGSIRPN